MPSTLSRRSIIQYLNEQISKMGSSGASLEPGGKDSTCPCRRCRFNPRVRKIPWRREWQLTSQYCYLGDPMGRGVRGVTQSWTRFSDNDIFQLEFISKLKLRSDGLPKSRLRWKKQLTRGGHTSRAEAMACV